LSCRGTLLGVVLGFQLEIGRTLAAHTAGDGISDDACRNARAAFCDLGNARVNRGVKLGSECCYLIFKRKFA
jgi:hypothetical protein